MGHINELPAFLAGQAEPCPGLFDRIVSLQENTEDHARRLRTLLSSAKHSAQSLTLLAEQPGQFGAMTAALAALLQLALDEVGDLERGTQAAVEAAADSLLKPDEEGGPPA